MYAKRGGVAANHIVWIGLCLRSVPGVHVLASAVDESSTVTPKSLLLKHSCMYAKRGGVAAPRLAYIQLWFK